ncbi:hypothetical protein Phum_PHUM512690 [Pediculus humanus corporis]|uniref:Uncharacterized protein n=1 Tax=Pediculus humanus subsp. corporis TaxID=121224 RepID=E0VYC0_PEDHC|nr:uncharacterized protein Phum_PHUM512690 [Pediculus humanus corporis]EEB18376.1 hypothetical protein Phum_PHUM512690 [Pediculus humanus corporis]
MAYTSGIEDVDLIEVLWKQDVDLGFSLNNFNSPKEEIQKKEVFDEDDIEKLKALEELKNENSNDDDDDDDDGKTSAESNVKISQMKDEGAEEDEAEEAFSFCVNECF